MKKYFSIKAFPWLILWGGFFFAGCAGLPLGEAPSAVSVEAEADYLAGVEQQGKELYDNALEYFSRSLERDPEGRTAPAAMHRIAEIYHLKGENRTALEFLEELEAKFPGYSESAGARLLKMEVLVSLEEVALALREGVSWAESNRDRRLYPKVCVLLGDLSLQTGDRAAAVRWWLDAYEGSGEDEELRSGAENRLNEILETSDPDDLALIADFAGGTELGPKVFHRMAEGYLSAGNVEKAEEAAAALIRSTEDAEWIDRAQKILEAVRSELSVKRNVIGCILPQSGPFAVYGREVLKGIQLGLAVEGEHFDSDIEIVIEDSGGEPEKAGEDFVRLAEEEKVIGVIGPLSSNVAGKIGEKAQNLGVPLIALTQKEGITGIGKQVFRNFIFPSREIKRLLDAAMGDLDIERYAVLYPENPYGRTMLELFREAVLGRGGKLIAAVGYEPGTTDFSGSIKELTGLDSPEKAGRGIHAQWPAEREEMEAPSSEGPEPFVDFDAIFIPDSYETVAMLAPQILYYDITGLWLLGTSAWKSPLLLEHAWEYLQRAIFSTGFFDESTRPGVDSFVKTYRAWYGSDPGVLAATGYDTINFLMRILHDQEISNRMLLRLAMEDCEPFSGVTGDISFDETGEVEKDPFLLTVHGSRFIEF
jgi:ABC-type branched-subunit amino acid transport system substrate-binding protein